MKEHLNCFLVFCLTLFIGACDEEPLAPSSNGAPADSVFVSLSIEPAGFLIGDSIRVHVTAENRSSSTVTYGIGSSTCTLHATVRTNGEDLPMMEDRMCSADESPWSLEPGETRTEEWDWWGIVFENPGHRYLPAGNYDLRGIAGPHESPPVEATIDE